ncbi:hypothetical protein [Aporhodopirellula aestuarii]|uniref:Uncharacterized protein n=1 Tax=Aporhodopirellula aestuarii TaxID=2950107 RepID=A0ABT0U4P0_9BACT|nr:hypothetical protein [Aporhodopirellula aestuarii]MCM2371902.1 hypothetical protein [Aporhodopirellula aestuarii]
MAATPAEPLQFSFPICRQDKMSAEDTRKYVRFAMGPVWRWQRARSVVTHGVVAANVDYGSEFWQVVDYRRGAPFDARTHYRGDHLLDIAAAETIFHDPATRLNVEARLLARLPPDVVAVRSGLATQTVRDYCDVYFDVLDSLDAKAWLACHVFDRDGKPVSDLHNIVCRESYRCGPAVCERWLAGIPHLHEDCDLATSRGREIKRLQLLLMRHQLPETDANRLCEVALRIGDLSSRQPSHFDNLSHVLGKRTAQVLGRFLGTEEYALPVVRSEDNSHILIGGRRHSA